MKHQQALPADLHAHLRPSEREIYRKDAPRTHMERPAQAGGGRLE